MVQIKEFISEDAAAELRQIGLEGDIQREMDELLEQAHGNLPVAQMLFEQRHNTDSALKPSPSDLAHARSVREAEQKAGNHREY